MVLPFLSGLLFLDSSECELVEHLADAIHVAGVAVTVLADHDSQYGCGDVVYFGFVSFIVISPVLASH